MVFDKLQPMQAKKYFLHFAKINRFFMDLPEEIGISQFKVSEWKFCWVDRGMFGRITQL